MPAMIVLAGEGWGSDTPASRNVDFHQALEASTPQEPGPQAEPGGEGQAVNHTS